MESIILGSSIESILLGPCKGAAMGCNGDIYGVVAFLLLVSRQFYFFKYHNICSVIFSKIAGIYIHMYLGPHKRAFPNILLAYIGAICWFYQAMLSLVISLL